MKQWTKQVGSGVAGIMLLGFCSLPLSALAEISSSNPTLYPPVEVGAASQKIPAGVKLRITFLNGVDSKTANVGDVFVAQASEDLWAGEQLILPRGTTLRGRVHMVQRPGFFSKGGLLRLAFDHIVMPSGELKPLQFEIDAATSKLNASKNGIYTDPGIGNKLNASVDKGISQYKSFYDKGVKAGEQRGGGINMLLTVPTNTVAGVLTGTAVTTVNAAKAVFGKGESAMIQPGEQMVIDFSQSATLPSQ